MKDSYCLFIKRVGVGVLLLFFTSKIYACSCAIINGYENRKGSYENAKYVVLAEIQNIKKGHSFQIKVIEVFKGHENLQGIRLYNIDSCSLFPEEGDTWILYIEPELNYLDKKKYLHVNDCFANRKLSKYSSLQVPVIWAKNKEVNYYKLLDQIFSAKELSWLRSMRLKELIRNNEVKIADSFQNKEKEEISLTQWLIYSVLFLLQIAILYKLYTRK